MAEEEPGVVPTRLAKALAVSLMMTMASPAAKAGETEVRTSEVLGEDERKRRATHLEAKSIAQTEKVQGGLPALGDEANAVIAEDKERIDAAAANLATRVLDATKAAQQDGPDVTEQLADQIVDASLSAGIDIARNSGNPFLRNITGNLTYDDGDIDFNLQTIGVLAGDSTGHLLLAQLGAHNELDQPTANVGLVYRWIDPSQSRLYGASLFYDHDFRGGAHRFGMGVEAATESLRVFANAYRPLSDDWFDIEGAPELEQRAASGHDLGVAWSPQRIPGLDLQLKRTRWRGERVDVFGSGDTLVDPRVWSAKLSFSPVPLFGVSVEREQAVDGVGDTRVMLNFNYRLGVPIAEQLDRRRLANRNDIASRAFAPVEREHRIVKEVREKDIPLAFDGPAVIRATIREDEVYRHLVNVRGNRGAFDLTLSGADASLFALQGSELTFDPKGHALAKPIEGDSLYDVVVSVRDRKGRHAQQAFVIEVVWLDADGDGLDIDREAELGTDPHKADTDGDGLEDGAEVVGGTDPLDPNDPGANAQPIVDIQMDGASLSGVPVVGTTLSAKVTRAKAAIDPQAVKYQWQIESAIGSGTYVAIPGATAATYVVRGTDQRRRIRVAVALQ